MYRQTDMRVLGGDRTLGCSWIMLRWQTGFPGDGMMAENLLDLKPPRQGPPTPLGGGGPGSVRGY
jgi:hypothetical protein